MRIMGLDFGAKTVGVAVSDALLLTAQAIETIKREKENKLRKTLARIEELIQEYQVEKIILGLPLNMDDTPGDRTAPTMEFADMLRRRTGLEVIMQPEQLTTREADAILIEAGIPLKNRKDYVDKIAAGYILQEYLDNNR